MSSMKNLKILSIGENVEKLEPLCTIDRNRNVKWYSCYMENSIAVPQKLKNIITIWSSNFISRYSKELKSVSQRNALYLNIIIFGWSFVCPTIISCSGRQRLIHLPLNLFKCTPRPPIAASYLEEFWIKKNEGKVFELALQRATRLVEMNSHNFWRMRSLLLPPGLGTCARNGDCHGQSFLPNWRAGDGDKAS